jgi:hypothetical protein
MSFSMISRSAGSIHGPRVTNCFPYGLATSSLGQAARGERTGGVEAWLDRLRWFGDACARLFGGSADGAARRLSARAAAGHVPLWLRERRKDCLGDIVEDLQCLFRKLVLDHFTFPRFGQLAALNSVCQGYGASIALIQSRRLMLAGEFMSRSLVRFVRGMGYRVSHFSAARKGRVKILQRLAEGFMINPSAYGRAPIESIFDTVGGDAKVTDVHGTISERNASPMQIEDLRLWVWPCRPIALQNA